MATTTAKTSAANITLGIALLHLLIAPTVDLSVDEAHYGLYARFLDWSYYDHPPMVGWILCLLRPLGLSEFTMRLPAAVLYSLCSFLLFHICCRMAGGHSTKALVAVIVFSFTPMVQLLGFGLVPELPLLMWALLLALVLNRNEEHESLRCWFYVGLLLGLAGLTKYTAILLVPGIILHWAIQGRLAKTFRQPGLYLALAVAAITVSPVFFWNYFHDWASFRYQLDHAGGGEWHLLDVFKTLLVQFFAYSPLIVIGGIMVLRDARQPGLRGLLVCMAIPVLAFVLAGSGNGASLPHWSLLGWILLIPSICHWLVENWQRNAIRRLGYIGTGIAVTLSLVILFVLTFRPLAIMPWASPALRDIIGWRQAAETAVTLQERYFPDDGVIMVTNWSRASRIAWYAWPAPVQVLDDEPGQFGYWYGEAGPETKGILIRDNLDRDDFPTLAFSRMGLWCEYLERVTAQEQGVEVNRFYFYACNPQDAARR